MTYYNPKIYNYSNLNDTDRECFYCMLLMYSTINDLLITKIAIDDLDVIKTNLLNTLIEFIVIAIDSYSNEVYKIDTDDYFYGFEKTDFDNLAIFTR